MLQHTKTLMIWDDPSWPQKGGTVDLSIWYLILVMVFWSLQFDRLWQFMFIWPSEVDIWTAFCMKSQLVALAADKHLYTVCCCHVLVSCSQPSGDWCVQWRWVVLGINQCNSWPGLCRKVMWGGPGLGCHCNRNTLNYIPGGVQNKIAWC